jgi:hypothetical protein
MQFISFSWTFKPRFEIWERQRRQLKDFNMSLLRPINKSFIHILFDAKTWTKNHMDLFPTWLIEHCIDRDYFAIFWYTKIKIFCAELLVLLAYFASSHLRNLRCWHRQVHSSLHYEHSTANPPSRVWIKCNKPRTTTCMLINIQCISI